MIVIWDNGESHDEHEVLFFAVESFTFDGIRQLLSLVDPNGYPVAVAKDVRWCHADASESPIAYASEARRMFVSEPEGAAFRSEVNQLRADVLEAVAAQLKAMDRPYDADDHFAVEILAEARWRARPLGRRRRG